MPLKKGVLTSKHSFFLRDANIIHIKWMCDNFMCVGNCWMVDYFDVVLLLHSIENKSTHMCINTHAPASPIRSIQPAASKACIQPFNHPTIRSSRPRVNKQYCCWHISYTPKYIIYIVKPKWEIAAAEAKPVDKHTIGDNVVAYIGLQCILNPLKPKGKQIVANTCKSKQTIYA